MSRASSLILPTLQQRFLILTADEDKVAGADGRTSFYSTTSFGGCFIRNWSARAMARPREPESV